MTPAPWRIDVLDRFEQRLTDAMSSILELGCGTGQLAAHLATHGWDVVAIDLSPGNVEATASRGIDAHVADFADLPFADGAFDAAFAFNSLLHVPKPELPAVYTEIRRVLNAGSVLLVVVWGGVRHEGPFDDEWLEPPRYFSLYEDDEFVSMARPGFEVVDFMTRDDTGEGDLRSQVLTLIAV